MMRMPYRDENNEVQDDDNDDSSSVKSSHSGGSVELQQHSSHHKHNNSFENDGLFVDRESDLQHRHRTKKKYSIIVWWMILVMTVVLSVMVVSLLKTSTKEATTPSQQSSSPNDNSNKNGHNNELPEITPYTYDEELLLCSEHVICKTDRLPYDQKLYVGQAICNDVWRLGVIHLYSTYLASLVWQDCNLGTTYYLQNVTLEHNGWDETSLAFQMTSDGTFQLYQVSIQQGEEITYTNDNKKYIKQPLVWEGPSSYKTDIQPTNQCLSHPIMPCPYLHLRKHGGNIVLNYISKQDSQDWKARPIKKAYPGLFPESYDP